MKFLIQIDQRAALAAGIDAPQSTITLDIPAADIPEDLRVDLAGHYDPKTGSYGQYSAYGLGGAMLPPITPESVIATWTQRREAVIAKREAELVDAIDRLQSNYGKATIERTWIAPNLGSVSYWHYRVHVWSVSPPSGKHDDPRWLAAVRECESSPAYLALIAEAERQSAASKAQAVIDHQYNQAHAEALKQAAAAQATVETAYVNEWITANADEDTQAQHAEGLLSRSAAVKLIESAALDALNLPGVADQAAVCEHDDCPCGAVLVDTLPRRIYPAWKHLKATLPAGYSVEFRKRRDCLTTPDAYGDISEYRASAPYWVAVVTVPVGPFHATRTVLLSPPQDPQ